MIANALSCKLLMINSTNSFNTVQKSKAQSPFWDLKQSIKSKHVTHFQYTVTDSKYSHSRQEVSKGRLGQSKTRSNKENHTCPISEVLYDIVWHLVVLRHNITSIASSLVPRRVLFLSSKALWAGSPLFATSLYILDFHPSSKIAQLSCLQHSKVSTAYSSRLF